MFKSIGYLPKRYHDYSLPGGGVDDGEHIEQGLIRELYHSALISDHSECVQRFLIKASLCSNGCSLSNSENAEQKPLGHSFQASFKRAYTALHDFERE
ncbi:NUDIX hydrolase [Shewanella saliphila]|uniref:NUDIX hydrolase n=1 Tax=Shewanella saliphila TaxID=2282698 RepID=UPI00357159AF